MADEFEWHTDVDGSWEPQEPEPQQTGPRPGRRLKFVALGVGGLFMLFAGFWVFASLRGRVEEATATAEGGLLIAHELLVEGALEGDRDLAESVVARRPSSWRDLNSDLIASQLFFGRRPLGIEAIGEQRAAAYDIRLSPDLNAAEIIDRRPYSVLAGHSVTETAILERVFHYEQTNDQWQLSPAADEREFWGNWITDERTNITLTYPERDEEVAIKLAGHLNEFLAALCAIEEMSCPADFHLDFKLEIDPTSIRRLGEGVFAIRASSASAGDRLVLPAPTLVGSPVDEAGYEALKRGYSAWIAAAIALGYGSSQSSPSDILTRLDLEPPLAAEQPLPRAARSTFPSGSAGPSQDVLVLCSDRISDRLLRFDTESGSWREERLGGLADRRFGAEAAQEQFRTSLYLSRLPDYGGAVVQTADGDGEDAVWRSYLWRDGETRLLTEEPVPHYFLPPRLQPSNQPYQDKLAFYAPGDDNGERFTALLVDMDVCENTPCKTRTLAGMPVWSPDGQQTLLIVAEPATGSTLYLGDSSGEIRQQVGPGQSPVWLDERQFVYVARELNSQPDMLGRPGFEKQVIRASFSDGTPTALAHEVYFDAESVRTAIPDSIRPESLALWTVQPALRGDEWWYVTATGVRGDKRSDYVVVYNPALGETRLAAPLEGFTLVEPPMINVTGRKAIATALSDDGSRLSVELIDAESGQIRRLTDVVVQDWSADGDWLIQSERGVLHLVSTASGAEWPVRHDMTGCYWAVWTER